MSTGSTTGVSPKPRLAWQGFVGLLGFFAGLCTIFAFVVTVAEGWARSRAQFTLRFLGIPLSMSSRSSLSDIPNPCERVNRVRRDGTRLPRSRRLIAVRCNPQ